MPTIVPQATALKAKLFRGFSDMSRLSILEALRAGPLTVGAIVEKTGLSVLPGVEDVRVLLSSEKAVLQVDPAQVDLPTIRNAIEEAGYTVPVPAADAHTQHASRSLSTFTRPILTLFGLVFGAVLLVV